LIGKAMAEGMIKMMNSGNHENNLTSIITKRNDNSIFFSSADLDLNILDISNFAMTSSKSRRLLETPTCDAEGFF